MPIIREFNKISNAVNALLGQRVASRGKISVMVKSIKRPSEVKSQIRVQSVEFTKVFEKQKKRGKERSSI